MWRLWQEAYLLCGNSRTCSCQHPDLRYLSLFLATRSGLYKWHCCFALFLATKNWVIRRRSDTQFFDDLAKCQVTDRSNSESLPVRSAVEKYSGTSILDIFYLLHWHWYIPTSVHFQISRPVIGSHHSYVKLDTISRSASSSQDLL